jgi:transposase InsO family protein
VRFAFIRAEKAHHSVLALCRVLNVTPQGFYASLQRQPSNRAKRDEQLAVKVRLVHLESRRTYGAPRVHAELKASGEAVSRKHVARLMRDQQLQARRKPRFVHTTNSRHGEPIAPNRLKRNFEVERPNQVWAADITYIDTRQGWLYLAVVLDLYSRKVVGWSMKPYLDARLVLGALQMAILGRNPPAGLVLHSDRGVQYACFDHREALEAAEMVLSMSGKGDCWDNAVVESFFSTLKNELVHVSDFATHDAARRAVFEYIEVFYNRQRRHSTLGYLSPAKYENDPRAA